MHQKFITLILLPNIIIPMEAPQRSRLQKLLHKFDKEMEPIQYITDNESSTLSEKLLKLNPKHKDYKECNLDTPTLENIHRGFERQQKLLQLVESDILSNSHVHIEQILRDVSSGYFSDNLRAIIKGYTENRLNKSQEIVAILQKKAPYHANENVSTLAKIANGSDNISSVSLEELILQPNEGWTSKALNYFRKTITDPIGYLTSSKSKTVAEKVTQFDPNRCPYVPLNPGLPLHQKLIHNAFEREIRLLSAIETALNGNNYSDILKIQESVQHEYYSEHVHAIIAFYLHLTAKQQTKTTIEKQKVIDNENRKIEELKKKAEEENKTKNEKASFALIPQKSTSSSSLPPATPPIPMAINPLGHSMDYLSPSIEKKLSNSLSNSPKKNEDQDSNDMLPNFFGENDEEFDNLFKSSEKQQ